MCSLINLRNLEPLIWRSSRSILFDALKSYWIRSTVVSVCNSDIQFFRSCIVLMLILFNCKIVVEVFGNIFLYLVIYKSAVLCCCYLLFKCVYFWFFIQVTCLCKWAFKIENSYCFVLWFVNVFNKIIFILSPDLTSITEMRIKNTKYIVLSEGALT